MKKQITVSVVALALLASMVLAFGVNGAKVTLAETDAAARTRQAEMSEWRTKLSEFTSASAAAKEQMRTKTAEKAKTIALKRVDKLIDRFKKLETVVENATNLTDAEKTEVKGKIDDEVIKLEDVATQIKTATTVTEIKEALTVARTEAGQSMQTVRKLIVDLRGTRLHNITKHLTKILETLTTKANALTLTDAQKTEFATLEDSVKANIAKADAAIDAKNYTEVKTDVAATKTDLLAMIAKINKIKAAAGSAETE